MNHKSKFIAVLGAVTLPGCWGYSISNIDKPAPETYEAWVKPGATRLEVKKALLECGKPAPAPNGWAYEYGMGIKDNDTLLNHKFLTDACMEKSGFRNRWGTTLEKSCRMHPEYRSYPACQPGAEIPERSVERRLNSWYCKLKTDLNYCLKHALNPSACTREGKDYNKPPPECLP